MPVCNVLVYRTAKENRILGNNPNTRSPRFRDELLNILAVEEDFTGGRVVEAEKKKLDGAFPAAAPATAIDQLVEAKV